MKDLRFPTQFSEHVLYYIQFRFFTLPPIQVNVQNVTATVRATLQEDTAREAGEVLANLFSDVFDYSARAIELEDTITLPLLSSVNETTSSNFEESSMGSVMNMVSIVSGGGRGRAEGGIMGLLSQIPGVTEGITGGIGFARQKAINERLKVFYKGPNFREYEFEFPLIARNLADAKKMIEISKRLHFHASPNSNDPTVWGYPNMVEFSFLKTKYNEQPDAATEPPTSAPPPDLVAVDSLFTSKKCYMTNVNIQHGDDRYFQFSDGFESETGAMTITLSLKEVEYFTQEDFGEVNDVPEVTTQSSQELDAAAQAFSSEESNSETVSAPETGGAVSNITQNVPGILQGE